MMAKHYAAPIKNDLGQSGVIKWTL